jgi:hypothetical protein
MQFGNLNLTAAKANHTSFPGHAPLHKLSQTLTITHIINIRSFIHPVDSILIECGEIEVVIPLFADLALRFNRRYHVVIYPEIPICWVIGLPHADLV